MSIAKVIATSAATWGFVMALAPALQIRRILGTRSSRDVSAGYYVILVPGFVLWVLHGITVGDPYLVVPNAAATVTAIVLLGCVWRFRPTDVEGKEPDETRP